MKREEQVRSLGNFSSNVRSNENESLTLDCISVNPKNFFFFFNHYVSIDVY